MATTEETLYFEGKYRQIFAALVVEISRLLHFRVISQCFTLKVVTPIIFTKKTGCYAVMISRQEESTMHHLANAQF